MILIQKNGAILYFHNQNMVIHRSGNLPAIAWASGSQEYIYKGAHHRDGDLPSIIDEFGVVYYKKGVKHRDNNLPATIFIKSGVAEYWEHGVHIRSGHM